MNEDCTLRDCCTIRFPAWMGLCAYPLLKQPQLAACIELIAQASRHSVREVENALVTETRRLRKYRTLNDDYSGAHSYMTIQWATTQLTIFLGEDAPSRQIVYEQGTVAIAMLEAAIDQAAQDVERI